MSSNNQSTDSELLQRVAQLDSKALEILYDRYSPILFTIIKRIVSDKQAAEEILTDVFEIIWKKIGLYDFNSNDAYTWLIMLARNKAVDYIRRAKDLATPSYTEEYENEFILPNLSKEIDPLDLNTALNIKDSVQKALSRLTDAQLYVIQLGLYEGLTEIEIAQKLNIPLPTVKSKIKLALHSFKDYLIKGDA